MSPVKKSIALAAALFLAGATAAYADAGFGLNGGVPNLAGLKANVTAYYDSGRQAADVARVIARAQAYAAMRLAAGAKRPAVVFDIDDTCVSSYTYQKSISFGFVLNLWNTWMRTDRFPVIKPSLAFAKYLHAKGVAIFFITGRREPDRAATVAEMAAAGFPAPTALYLRSVSDKNVSVIPFKSGTRAKIASQGYDILESIGDQWSDLRGGHADRIYKLPNPMYFLP
ncbi:MAG TPA: HAD family acid phosphatase [Candidatus Rubrimentiphilum sp.]|nr:HAD family acid phosphatase [Candidatus Rubrimentiphilum sp.]